MWLKVLGGVLLVWLAFAVLGALFKFLTWALVIGAVVFVGAGVHAAVKGRNRRALGR